MGRVLRKLKRSVRVGGKKLDGCANVRLSPHQFRYGMGEASAGVLSDRSDMDDSWETKRRHVLIFDRLPGTDPAGRTKVRGPGGMVRMKAET